MSGKRNEAMDELKWLARRALERLRQVAEDALGRAALALWPLIEQSLVRLEALRELVNFLLLIGFQTWLELALGLLQDRHFGEDFGNVMVAWLIGAVVFVAALVTAIVLFIAVPAKRSRGR